jgi:hypothetical protein
MNKNTTTCKDCWFFERTNVAGGQCRRYPPKTFDTLVINQNNDGVFPNVNESWWCGEWEPAEDLTNGNSKPNVSKL